MHDQTASLDAPEAEKSAFIYRRQSGLAWLVLKNIVLNVVTLFFYRFWARTNWRRHLWSNVVLRGDPFEYTGTGLEMFKGFLIAMAVLAPLLIGFKIWEGFIDRTGAMALVENLCYFVTLYALTCIAGFYARRYRLSRTRWRGVAFALDARFRSYLSLVLKTDLLAIFTLFLLLPRASLTKEVWILRQTRFGSRFFSGEPDWKKLMPYWLVVWASMITTATIVGFAMATARANYAAKMPVFGIIGDAISSVVIALLPGVATVISYAFYRAIRFRLIANATRLDEILFVSTARPIRLLGFAAIFTVATVVGGVVVIATGIYLAFLLARDDAVLVAFLIQFGILGVCWILYVILRDIWLIPRIVGHLVSTLTIENAQQLDGIAAGSEASSSRGEGLADSFDVGIG